MLKRINEWIYRIQNYEILNQYYFELIGWYDECQTKLQECKYNLPSELETYWNTQRPVKLITWKARDKLTIDLRCFFQTDGTLPKFKGSNDEIVSDVLSWTILNFKYMSDTGEFWQYAYESMLSKTGDCEDGAILMANICLNSGVPYWRIRLNKGWVRFPNKNKQYHAFMTYLSESDNKWKMVDWCYLPDECRDLKLNWKESEKYFSPDSSWNQKYGFKGLRK